MEYINKRILWIALVAGILILVFSNYSYFDQGVKNFVGEYERANVKRVIDGDTIVVLNSDDKNSGKEKTIRLLGINSPEEGEEYYKEGKEYLEELINNRTIRIKYGLEKKGIYGRYLGYIYFNGRNLNKEMIEKGYANPYFPSGKNEYYKDFYNSWKKCVSKDRNYCYSSKHKCSDCINLETLDYKKQKVILKNSCSFSCNLSGWEIKDEGRKNFDFSDFVLQEGDKVKIKVIEEKEEDKKVNCESEDVLCWKRKSYVWTDTGDALFLRDSTGDLVLWENY